ncbi:MAG: cell division protein PerM [Nocardioidaceae bacterium]
MTDLLTRVRSAQALGSPGGPFATSGRPLVLSAGFAGAAAAGSALLGCMALALVGWFASDAGAYGQTTDAIRVGADAWLLAQGGHLELAGATISVVPLGLTAVCGYVALRLGRWAGQVSPARSSKELAAGVATLAGGYAAVTLITALLADAPAAHPHTVGAVVGSFLLSAVLGGGGILAGAGRLRTLATLLPETLRAVLTAAVAAVLLLVAVGAAVLALALLGDLGSAANVLSRLHADATGAALYTVVVAAVAPNAVLLAGAYVLGPGFAVGTGTVVSTSSVTLGPVPAFPLLAALPKDGVPPWWTELFVVVPVLVAFVAVVAAARRFPTGSYEVGVARGLGAGLLGGLAFGLLTAIAGGSVGPGRMAHVGAPVGACVGAAVVAMGIGGVLGGLAATWWSRRRDEPADAVDAVRPLGR